MLGALKDCPYLAANIPLLVTVVVVGRYLRPREIGRVIVPAGLLCVPSALIAFTFQGDSWTPDRVGGLLIGIEDLVFCFVAGALAWILAAWPFRRRIRATVQWRAALPRFGALGLFGGSVIIGSHLWGWHSMAGYTAASLFVLAVILAVRRDLWVIAAAGTALFTTMHVLIVRIQFWIWPDYVAYWSREGLLGTTIAGVPLIEPLWAAIFGGVWPVVVGFAFDARLDRNEDPPP